MRPSQRISLHPATHGPSQLDTNVFDVVCIGSGWAGHVLAAGITKAGLSALVVEDELIGGDCPYWACVPSKTLLRSPEALEAARRVGGARERINNGRVDVDATFQRRDMIVADWDDTKVLAPIVEASGTKILRGWGTITGPKKVKVTVRGEGEGVDLEARLAVALCTGSEPIMPSIPGLLEANPWTPRDATSASYVPDHLVVLGSGAVGSEMATAYSKFGGRVSLISRGGLLPGFDPEAADIVQGSLQSRGIGLYIGVGVISVQRTSDQEVVLQLSDGRQVHGTEILVAAGRKARTNGVGLERVGYEPNEHFVAVHEDMRVRGVPGHWLYAVGDVNGRGGLTHTSKYQGSIAANAIVAASQGQLDDPPPWSPRAATADTCAIPRVIFTDPVVASVGRTRTKAEREGKHVREVSVPLASPDGIHGDNELTGWAQWLFDGDDRLVGATFVGPNAAELLHPSTVAIVGGLTLHRLRHAIPSWPTLSWVYYDLMDAADT